MDLARRRCWVSNVAVLVELMKPNQRSSERFREYFENTPSRKAADPLKMLIQMMSVARVYCEIEILDHHFSRFRRTVFSRYPVPRRPCCDLGSHRLYLG